MSTAFDRDRALFAREALEWTRRHHPTRIGGATAMMLLEILERGHEFDSLEALQAATGYAASTARWRCEKKLLPRPAQWFQLARALHAARLIREHPEKSATRCALDLGFTSHSSLSHALRRTLGVGVSDVREIDAWEPLLARWWERCGRTAVAS